MNLLIGFAVLGALFGLIVWLGRSIEPRQGGG